MGEPDPVRRIAEQIEIGAEKGYFGPKELLAKLVAAYHERMIEVSRCPWCGQYIFQTEQDEKVSDAMDRLEDLEA